MIGAVWRPPTHDRGDLAASAQGPLAYAIGGATGSRALAMWVSAGIAVLAYLANGVLPMVRGLEWTNNLSPFHWYLNGDPLKNGLQVGGPLLLIGVAAVLVAVGTLAFTRRDIGT